jgi:hypothetical protein
MTEALNPIFKFRRYRIKFSMAIELYSMLRATIKSARTVSHLKLLINDQTIPNIMGKMPLTNSKQLVTSWSKCMQEEIEEAFERFMDPKMERCPQHGCS